MKSAFRLTFGVALAALLLWLATRGVDSAELVAAMAHARPLPLILVVVITVLMYVVRAMRWRLLFPPLRDASIFDLFGITNIGFMAGLFIPRAGEILRPYLAARRYKVGVSAGLASIILERLIDLITVLFLLALYMFVLPRPATERSDVIMTTLRAGAGLVFLVALAGLVFLGALRVEGGPARRLLDWILGLLPRSLGMKVRGLVDSFISGLDVFGSSPAQWARLMAESLLLWVGIGLIVHMNSIAFGFEIPFHSAFLIIAFLTVGVAIPTPGMVGGFHASYTLALTAIYGVDQGSAVAAGLVLHALQSLPVLILGIAFLGREGLSFGGMRQLTQRAEP
ncbi:MAG: flippase-like domain-containing protein [Vicinamibacteria bacterium]|nr:flippase-like domain-containing protein [Vicinamibacteria bacterium]